MCVWGGGEIGLALSITILLHCLVVSVVIISGLLTEKRKEKKKLGLILAVLCFELMLKKCTQFVEEMLKRLPH